MFKLKEIIFKILRNHNLHSKTLNTFYEEGIRYAKALIMLTNENIFIIIYVNLKEYFIMCQNIISFRSYSWS